MRRARGISLLGAALASPVAAQSLDRGVRPTAPPPAAFQFPTVSSHTLPNGLRLLVVEDHSVPVVAVRAALGTDSTADPRGKEGLFDATLGVMRDGSTTRDGDGLARAAAAIGTNVSPTGFTTVTSAFGAALDLMADMLTHPAFDSAAVERRKATQAAAARRVAQAPATLPRRLFYALAFAADDPFVRSLLPTEASIASITRNDIVDFYGLYFAPARTTIVVVGDVEDPSVVGAVERAFGSWRAPGQPPNLEDVGIGRSAPGIYLHDIPGPRAYIYIGHAGPPRTAADAAATELLGVVAAARLQQTLREKRSFMYSGTVGLTWRRDTGAEFVGSANVDATRADSALVEWLSILSGLRGDKPVSGDELEAARRDRIGSLPARVDGPDSIATRLVEISRDHLPLDHYERYVRQVSGVTSADVAAAASRYLDPDRMIIVVTGDRTVLEPSLRAAKLGPVFVVDALGKPIP